MASSQSLPRNTPASRPTTEDAIHLFEAIQATFPSETLGADRWYLVALSALAGSPYPELAACLYSHLTSQPAHATTAARQALMRRLREVLVKDVAIVGVCKPLEAVIRIAEVERDDDRDYSFSREHWQSGPENVARGRAWLGEIYRHNLPSTEGRFAAHKDFGWITNEITYGLYLSDHSILDAIDTELVVLSAIMIQNLKNETAWHLRGSRRVGMSTHDVEAVQQCIELVADFAGIKLDRVPRVVDIEHEV